MKRGELNKLKNELLPYKELAIEKRLIDSFKEDEQISKKQVVYNLPCTVMFVDMRNSTIITDDNGLKNMVKIYKMFAKLVVKSVENNLGNVAQIMGDGMFCIFTNKDNVSSGQLAVDSAISINTYLSEVYNKIVNNKWQIECGIGIQTGHVFITKVGIKGKKECSKVIYAGPTTNYASKLCDIAKGGEIIFDKATYNVLDKACKKLAYKTNCDFNGNYKMMDVTWEITN